MQYKSLLKRKIFGVGLEELLLVLLLYFVFGMFYFFTLVVVGAGWGIAKQIPIYYALTLLYTIPIWYLLFRKWRHLRFGYKVLIHLILIPFVIYFWREAFYLTCDLLGIGHLRGTATAWDIYIPSMFYLIQFGFYHMYDYYLEVQKHQEQEAELRQLALQSELSALKAQINPHFLYNVFNSISASMPPGNEHPRELLAKLSDLFRYQLKATQQELVKVSEELDFVKKYLDLEKERFGDRLQIRYKVEDGVLKRKIPPMLLQPLVENAIKHGISPLVEGGEIEIIITEEDGEVAFAVNDTGVGTEEENYSELIGQGIGLTNTHRRLMRRFGAGLQFLGNDPRGLSVQFSIPGGSQYSKI